MAVATPMSAENWAKLLEPGLRQVFSVRLGEYRDADKASILFSKPPTSRRAHEEELGVGAIGADDWNFEDTGRVQYDAMDKGFLATFRHREFAKGIMVRRSFIDDNLYPGAAGLPSALTGRVEALADAAFIMEQTAAAEVYNHAFTDSGKTAKGFPMAGPDGVGLCSTAHPMAENSSVTISNEGTSALSLTAIRDSRVAARRWTDDRGNITPVNLVELLVPPELEDQALVLQTSQMEPGNANNDANVIGKRIQRVISWEYLLDTNAWFLQDPVLRSRMLKWFDRNALEFAVEGDFDTLMAKYRAYRRYSRGWSHPLFVFGHNPS